MKTNTYTDIAEAFIEAAHSQVWCSVASLDTKNRLRSRVLHPIWENGTDFPTGWIATGRNTLKAKHLLHNPTLSLCYMVDPLKPLYVDCRGEWVDEMAEKQRLWDLLRTTPPPLGYDPAHFFGTVDNPGFGILKLTPWRIELGDLFGQARVWQASSAQ